MEEKREPHQIISKAAEVASAVVAKAEEVAKQVAAESEDRNTKSLVAALRQVFGENEEAKRFVDISRIPLICQNIDGIFKRLDKIDSKLDNNFVSVESFWPVKTLVYGFVTLILIAVVGAIIALVINK